VPRPAMVVDLDVLSPCYLVVSEKFVFFCE
jgi:hypothetical protein